VARKKKQFLLCVRNRGFEDLELRKVYELLPDVRSARDGFVRVVDETGEDYLYPARNFVALELSKEAERVLRTAVRKRSSA
jgi:hypothetical protein